MKKIEFIAYLTNTGLYILKILLMLALLFAVFMFFRWAGVKGMLSFILGMFLMSWLILSKNMVMRTLIEMTKSESYINEVVGKDEKKK